MQLMQTWRAEVRLASIGVLPSYIQPHIQYGPTSASHGVHDDHLSLGLSCFTSGFPSPKRFHWNAKGLQVRWPYTRGLPSRCHD